MIDEGNLTLSNRVALSACALSLLSKKNGFILVDTLYAPLFGQLDHCDIRSFTTIAWQAVDGFLYVLGLSTVDGKSRRYLLV